MTSVATNVLRCTKKYKVELLIFFCASFYFASLAWLVSGPKAWWILDFINGTNVFYGDDAYRFYLANSAWADVSLYEYNFILPVSLFLEGVVTFVAGNDLLASRIIHGFLGAVELVLLWAIGNRLKIKKVYLFLSLILLLLFPRYAFTTISFYGEFWLGLLLTVACWFYVKKNYKSCIFVIALLPLVRPEGIFFWCVSVIFLLYKRKFIYVASSVLPGLLYLIFLFFRLDHIKYYTYWRLELVQILQKIPFNHGEWEILKVSSFIYLFFVALGFFNKKIKDICLFFVGAIIWIVYLQFSVLVGSAKFEERYLYSVFPLLTIAWAAGLDMIGEQAFSRRFSWLKISILPIFVYTFFLNITTLDSIKISTGKIGYVATFKNILTGGKGGVFVKHDAESMLSRKIIVNDIYDKLSENKKIDKIIVGDPFLFYFLDPRKIPTKVTVGYPAAPYMIFSLLTDGELFIQHSRNKKYSYISLFVPQESFFERRLLYIDLIPNRKLNNFYEYPGLYYRLYDFAYQESSALKNSIFMKDTLTPQDINNSWREWFREE